MRKNELVLKDLREKPKKTKSCILSELKCLMSSNKNFDKFFMSRFIVKKALTKILEHEKSQG